MDLLPTVADLVAAELPPDACEGRSLAPLLGGGHLEPAEPRIAESFYGRNEACGWLDPLDLKAASRRVSFQWPELKLLVDCTTGACEAYDLGTDPSEASDLAGARPELVQAARRLARLHVRRCERVRIGRARLERTGGTP
jgi:arylsulfatase A-like enzyme